MSKKHRENKSSLLIEKAIEVLKIEAQGILKLIDRLDENFNELVDLICHSKGRVIISGIGKSGIVARKIVATLNSTGTRSLFLHPVEAMHGDLGQVSNEDIFLALSNSGDTDELNLLLPRIRSMGCKIVAFTGNTQSTLAENSDLVIDVGVECEAGHLGLAPTASTTAQLAMGDALAVVLLEKKNFKMSDFKRIHPGGSLGQRLASKVKNIMFSGKGLPLVPEKTSMKEAIQEINRGGLGATMVEGSGHILTGIITDGDIRRMVAANRPVAELTVEDIMTKQPRAIDPEAPAYDALYMMEKHQITVLPAVNARGEIQGILHLHDILGKGQFKFNNT